MRDQPVIFIIEDDDAVRESLGMIIETAGYTQQSFDSIEHFLKACDPGMPGCLILDANESGLTNLELRDEFNLRNILVPILFLTRYGDLPMDLTVANYGRAAVLTKPVQIEVLFKTIQKLLQPEPKATSQDGIDTT
jgi:FixJ family two-component response regulator